MVMKKRKFSTEREKSQGQPNPPSLPRKIIIIKNKNLS
jgi:hypothetical protein